MAAAAASSAPSTVVSVSARVIASTLLSHPLLLCPLQSPRIPLCPFPNVAFSGALEASPPTSGLGVLVTLPPYFNWSSFLQASDSPVGSLVRYRIMPSASLPGSLIPTEGIPVTLVKGPSGLGGSPFSDTLQARETRAPRRSSASPMAAFARRSGIGTPRRCPGVTLLRLSCRSSLTTLTSRGLCLLTARLGCKLSQQRRSGNSSTGTQQITMDGGPWLRSRSLTLLRAATCMP